MTAGNTGVIRPRGEDERKGGRSEGREEGRQGKQRRPFGGARAVGLPVANARLVVLRAERRGPLGGRG